MIARLDLVEGNVFLGSRAVGDQAGRFRARSRSARMAALVRLRARKFQHLAEQDQRRDGGGGFEVDVGVSAHARAANRGKISGREPVATTL